MIRSHPALLVTVLALTTAARADEGRLPIHASATLTQPGYYLVTRDFTGFLAVQASGVTVDLGGRTVTVPSGNTGIAVSSAVARVTIRNGTLLGGTAGITFDPVANTAASIVIEDVTVNGPSSHGAYIQGGLARVRISRSVFAGTGGKGIFVGCSDTPCSTVLEDNVVRGAATEGVQIVNAALRMTGCTVGPAGASAVTVIGSQGALVEGCKVFGSPLGFLVDSGSSGAVVRGNVATGITGAGFWFQGARHSVVGNQSEGNGGCGITFTASSSSSYRENTLRGNTGGSVCGAATDAGGNVL